MLKMNPMVLSIALATAMVSAPLSAQSRSVVTSATLENAVTAPETVRPTTDRAAVTAALTSTHAIAAAKRLGVSAEELTARVAVLDEADVQRISERVLVGGSSTIVISTTTVIIALLILILITD